MSEEEKKVDPKVSAYMSEMAKKRKNPYFGFKDKATAKKAGDRGRETQRIKRKRATGGQDQADSQS